MSFVHADNHDHLRQAAAAVVLAAVDTDAWPNPIKWSLPEGTAAAVQSLPSTLADNANVSRRLRTALQMGFGPASPFKAKQSE